jgi:apolipoprotein N-acyltransferase
MTYVFCILSSLLIISSFPKINFFLSAWISLIPWVIALYYSKNLKNALIKSFLVGFISCIGIMYWLIPMFSVAGFNIILGSFLFFLMAFYMSLYFVGIGFAIFKYKNYFHKFYFPIFIAGLWVVIELIKNYFFTGFPWMLLGYSQWNNRLVIQIAEYTGIYGVSFLIVLCNMVLASLIISVVGQTFRFAFFFRKAKALPYIVEEKARLKPYHTLILQLIFLLILISSVLFFGYKKIQNIENNKNNNEKFSICVLQGNIDQYKKFDFEYKEFIKSRYEYLVNSSTKNMDLYIWPETSYPGLYPNDTLLYSWLRNVVINSNSKHLVGMFVKDEGKFYNTILFVDEKAKELDRYYKVHLVPFGEVFPYKNVIEKIIPSVRDLGDVTSGVKQNNFKFKNNYLGLTICFEVLFPNEVRNIVKSGANVLINVSNDAWYLDTSAPWELLVFNVFRAVENRREIVRSANTGISAFIDQTGKIKKMLGVFETGILVDKAEFNNNLTFYTKYGDIFAYICIILVGIFVLVL